MRLHKKYGLNPTITQCFFCGKDKNEIALLGAAYKNQAPTHAVIDKEPCEKYKKYMEMGIMFVSVKDNTDQENPYNQENPYRTGKIAVIIEQAAKKIFGDSIGKFRFAFVEDKAWKKIGL